MTGSVNRQLPTCADILLPGKGKCVETNHCVLKRAGGFLQLLATARDGYHQLLPVKRHSIDW